MKANKLTLSLVTLLFASSSIGQTLETDGDFKSLFNKYRVAQPKIIPWSGNFFPYYSDGTAIKLNRAGNNDGRGTSPMQAYDKIMNLDTAAHDWEKEVHSCEPLTGAAKKSCESWWGHCNGWAAAAIKESEPRDSVTVKGRTLSVADRKGILSELWLASYSLNSGLSDKSKKVGSWVHKHQTSGEEFAYQAFWDVSPRAFFMVLTNQIGVNKTGIVIDRHAGEEVWNQPVVGYRFMPIEKKNIKLKKDGEYQYWSVKIGVKLFWANDLGIKAGHVSQPFDIFKMTKDESGLVGLVSEVEHISEDYEGRYLEFHLNFDDEVEVSPDGTRIVKAGSLIDDGYWDHQLNSKKYTLDQLAHSHPDFFWVPTNPYQDESGYGNPYLKASVARLISGKSSGSSSSEVVTPGPVELKFRFRDFKTDELDVAEVKRQVRAVLLRDSIKSKSMKVKFSGDDVLVSMILVDADVKNLRSLFRAAKLPFTVE